MLSSRWRGTTVTSSISARKATSAWVKPGGKGSAILYLVCTRRIECHLVMFDCDCGRMVARAVQGKSTVRSCAEVAVLKRGAHCRVLNWH
jgi:hypothetical protein